MDIDSINDLIWGDFERKITQMQVPLYTVTPLMMADAKNGAYALFNGFLTFLMFRLGYKPKLPKGFKADLEDNSWWVQNLDKVEFMGMSFIDEEDDHIPPFVFKQFFNGIGNNVTICILLDWFVFYQCGLVLRESKLSEDLKYSDKIKDEFHLISDENFDRILKYMKNLKDKDFASTHKLVLRPDKLADILIKLNEMLIDLEDFPERIFTKGQTRTLDRSDLVFCTEDNFKQLLEKASIVIPNVEFQGFNQFLQDNLIDIGNEWPDIRDRYINNLREKTREWFIEPHLDKDFTRSKKYLQDARMSLDSKNFVTSIISASKAVEYCLSIILKKSDLSYTNKIRELGSNQELKGHIPDLDYIRIRRNGVAHLGDDDVTEEITQSVLEMADRFVASAQKTI